MTLVFDKIEENYDNNILLKNKTNNKNAALISNNVHFLANKTLQY